VLGATVVNQVMTRYVAMDNSKNRAAEECARNYLKGLEENAILITSGDTDTWLPLYLQVAEGYRDDVTICSRSLLNAFWFISTLLEREPEFPMALGLDELAQLRPMAWQDSTVSIASGSDEDTLRIHVEATLCGEHKILLVSDQLLLEIIKDNQWRRPVYFTSPVRWLETHVRLEGMVSRLVPLQGAAIDSDILWRNLMKTYGYAGYDDESKPLESPALSVATNLMRAFAMLATEEISSGDLEACRATLKKMDEVLPPERVERPDYVKAYLEQLEAIASEEGRSDN
jgi:hypothetical protein